MYLLSIIFENYYIRININILQTLGSPRDSVNGATRNDIKGSLAMDLLELAPLKERKGRSRTGSLDQSVSSDKGIIYI